MVRAGGRGLVSAPSNVAVDNLLEKLHRHRVRVVRLGHPARAAEELQCLSLDARVAGSEEGALVRDVYRELDQAVRGGRRARGEVRELRKEARERVRGQAAMKCALCVCVCVRREGGHGSKPG